MRRHSVPVPASPPLDPDAEASHISVQSAPGAVFVRLRRERGGRMVRRMFVELTVEEARALQQDLAACIGKAAETAGPA